MPALERKEKNRTNKLILKNLPARNFACRCLS